jgi:hypothetical protein
VQRQRGHGLLSAVAYLGPEPRMRHTMLEQLLQTLQSGGTHTLSGLARELNTSETLVEMMVEELASRGYLQAANVSCTEQCTGCPTAPLCVVGGATRVWTLANGA